ncbi:MAG: hypothetical protein MUF34_18610 [Polyangiaceae bacterium]|nr:hypothetical protein [Polyangiaceae bacterium]
MMLERRSPDFDVLTDVPLAHEPQRADLVLLRKRQARKRPARGAVLRELWPKLGSDTLVEFKSAARPLRRGDLVRLLGYGAQYHVQHVRRLDRQELGLVLVVPGRSRTLDDELARLGWKLGRSDGGYARLQGEPYAGWVVFLDEVGRVKEEGVLAPFVGATVELGSEAWGRWQQRLFRPAGGTAMPNVSELEGYDELMVQMLSHELMVQMLSRVPASRLGWVLAKVSAKAFSPIPAERLAEKLTVEQLAALPAEKRLAGLSVRERLAGLSEAELNALRAELAEPSKAKPKRRRPKAPR